MSLAAVKAAWPHRIDDCKVKILLLALANRANADGEAWPSLRDLEAMCGLSRRSVQRGLEVLEATGFIQRRARYRRLGSRASDLFQMLFLAPDFIPKPAPKAVANSASLTPLDTTCIPANVTPLTTFELSTRGNKIRAAEKKKYAKGSGYGSGEEAPVVSLAAVRAVLGGRS